MRTIKIVNDTFIRGKIVPPGKIFTEDELKEKFGTEKSDLDNLLASGNAILAEKKNSKKDIQIDKDNAKIPSQENPFGMKAIDDEE